MGHWARRASRVSLERRVFPEAWARQGAATLGPPGTEESPETPVSPVYPEHPVSPERKVQPCPARYLESLENPATPVSPDDQVTKGCLVLVETMVVLVSMDPKEKEETQVTEGSQDHKASRAPEETPVFQALRQGVSMVLEERTVCPVSLERKANPERCWGPRLGLPESTASQELPETRASLEPPVDLVHLVWMGALEYPG